MWPEPVASTTAPALLPLVGEGLTVIREDRRLIDAVDLTLSPKPGVTVLLGPNGAGKSLLLQLQTGLLRPDSGRVTWAGRPPSPAVSKRIGYVFQKPVLFRRSVVANVIFSLAATGCPKHLLAGRAREALAMAGLADLANQPARSLSGGEQQRLALARALSYSPALLVLDEPTAHLDPGSVAAIEKLVAHAAARGTVVLLVTHDIAQARRLAGDVLFMNRGRILEAREAQPFFTRPDTAEARTYLAGELLT